MRRPAPVARPASEPAMTINMALGSLTGEADQPFMSL
jgi:hypothetical protein